MVTVINLAVYFRLHAYTFYTLHVSNAYFPKVCMKYAPTRKMSRLLRHHLGVVSLIFLFISSWYSCRGTFVVSLIRSLSLSLSFSLPFSSTRSHNTLLPTVRFTLTENELFVLSIYVGCGTKYRSNARLSISLLMHCYIESTINAVCIHHFIREIFTFYKKFHHFICILPLFIFESFCLEN